MSLGILRTLSHAIKTRITAIKIIAAAVIIAAIVTASIFVIEKGLEIFRSAFLWVGLVSEFAVGVGICIESWPPKSRKAKIAFLLIVPGVMLGAVCTILLFNTDEIISSAQQGEIIRLNGETKTALTKATAASNRAALLEKENINLEKTLSPRLIDQRKLSEELNKLNKVNVFISSKENEEAQKTALDIYTSFNLSIIGKNKPLWQIALLPSDPPYDDGITIEYAASSNSKEFRIDTDPNAKEMAISLCKNLKIQNISAEVRVKWTDFSPYTKDWLAPVSSIFVRVGNKPSLFLINKTLRAIGRNALPNLAFCDADDLVSMRRKEGLEERQHP